MSFVEDGPTPGGDGGNGVPIVGPVGSINDKDAGKKPRSGQDTPLIPGSDPPEPPYAPTAGQFANLRAMLNRYGLGALYDTAVDWITSDFDDSQLLNALWETPEFRTRFKGIFAREENGLPPISIDEYLAYEDEAHKLFREAGLPPGFYDDPDDFAGMIGGNVGMNELRQRVESYIDLAAVGREQVRLELSRQFGDGVGSQVDAMTDGDLAAWMIDPDRGLQTIRQRVAAAGVGAAAARSGFGSLSHAEASELTGVGVTEEQARQSFEALAAQGDVTGTLAGESADGGFGRDEGLGVVAGDASALSALERRRRGRQGAFEGRGGFATGQEGIGGLGRA